MLRAAGLAALALVGLVGALWFFTSRDDASTAAPPAQAPGRAFADPGDADLRRGNVKVTVYAAAQLAAVRRVASEVAGPATPALRAAGQAVLVTDNGAGPIVVTKPACVAPAGKRADCTLPPIVARADGRILEAQRGDDPALRAFLEYWIGRAGK